MQVTGMLYGAKLLQFAGFPAAEVLGPDASEAEIKALIDSGREKQVVFVGHDVTVMTRKLLLQGVMDVVISQNPGHEARAAVRVLLALARGEPILSEQEQIRIDIVMRDNLP